jgi:hypothetical protein
MALPVRKTCELRATLNEAAPVARSRLPLAGALKVFSTHVLLPEFGIGTGVPKLQPVSVQSGAALLAGGIVEVAPTAQADPLQVSPYRLVEPSGVGPSGLVE